jgi:hypothetical protein
MDEHFRYSKILRLSELERFIGHEEMVRRELDNISESEIHFKIRENAIFVEVINFEGEKFTDIFKIEDMDKDQYKKWFNFALGAKDDK